MSAGELDLETLRRAAVQGADGGASDPRAVYRWRVAAVRAGFDLWPQPGDGVVVDGGAAVLADGRVLAVEESAAGPARVRALLSSGAVVEPLPGTWRVVGPHRPAVLLGEEELRRRLEEDLPHAGEERGVETLLEVARRGWREAVEVALDLIPQLDQGELDPLRAALSALLRCRPPGEVEVALLRRPREQRDLLELPALAASAPDADAAKDVLDRLEALPPATAARVVGRARRWLVGAGGPGFVAALLRERVGALSREHPDLHARRALFVHAAAPLTREDLVAAALASADPTVRAASAAELLRRGVTAPVWARARREDDLGVLSTILARSEQAGAAPPHDVLQHVLERASAPGEPAAALERLALRRLPELEDVAAARELVRPWLDGRRSGSTADALWAAGLTGGDDAAELVLERARESDALQAVALEALARLGGPLAEDALDAWGAALLRGSPCHEEVALTAGLLLGRGVDVLDLLSHFAVDPPRGPLRRARLLDVTTVGARGGAAERAFAQRLLRGAPPARQQRFRAQEGAPQTA
jgi:hypothetical protein